MIFSELQLFTKYSLLVWFFLTLFATGSMAQNREIALTIDDLPFVGDSKNFHLNMIIEAFIKGDIPATGFVIAGKISKDNWSVLQKFREAGLGLGNHTLTHANLNQMATESYIQEIATADKILRPILTKPKYFRYPYLATSNGKKKEVIANYLAEKKYRVAPITIDSKDFIFNQLLLSVPESQRRSFLDALKPCYLDFIQKQTLRAEEHNRQAKRPDQPQILLIHANLLNAYVLPDLIRLYKQNGYTFISLEEALKPVAKRGKSSEQNLAKADFDRDSFVAWD